MVEQGEWKGFSDRELKNFKQGQQTSKLPAHVPNGPQRNTYKPIHYGSCKPPTGKGSKGGESGEVAGGPSSSPAEQMPVGAFFHKPSDKGAPLKIHAYPVAAETKTKSSVSETKLSVSETKSSVSETKLSVSETKSSVSETKSSVSETKSSVSETKSSVSETKSSVPEVKSQVPSHSNVKDQKSAGQKASTETEKQKDEHQARPSVERGNSSELDDVVFSERPLADTLELMQKRQREIEAANKKKRALVQQTLMERYKQSQMEAKTLELVKRELDHVDDLVTRDVSVLRDKIEDANRDYNLARKRYELAEAEFIAAKIELHKTSELKELLSEHLCAVIQQNEARKARKLAELLQTLDLAPEDSEVSLAAAALVQKTPTPGLEIWPRDRLRNSGSLSSPKGTPTEDAVMKSELKSDGSTTQLANSDSTSRAGGDHSTPNSDSTSRAGGDHNTPNSDSSSRAGGDHSTPNSDSTSRSGGDHSTPNSASTSRSGGDHSTPNSASTSRSGGDHSTPNSDSTSRSGGDHSTSGNSDSTSRSGGDHNASTPQSGNTPTSGGDHSSTPQDTVHDVDDSLSDCGKTNSSRLSPRPPSATNGDSTDSHRDSRHIAALASGEPGEMNSDPEADKTSISTDSAADEDLQTPPTRLEQTPPTTPVQTPPTTLETPPTGSDS